MLMNTTKSPSLVILATDIDFHDHGDNNYLEAVGECGEFIVDYSVHDAVKAGFKKIVFVIRRDIEAEFRIMIGNRINMLCERAKVQCHYVFQEIDDLPYGFSIPEGRTKLWGTGQAVLSCRGIIQEPFCIISADAYYGKDAFFKLYTFLTNDGAQHINHFCMVGYLLKNTLSQRCAVTRSICQIDQGGYLMHLVDNSDIIPTRDGVSGNGEILNPQSVVSVNIWGVTPMLFNVLEEEFCQFLKTLSVNALTSQFQLSNVIDHLVQKGTVSVRVLQTKGQWLRIMCHEDKADVVSAFAMMMRRKEYQSPLFDDILLKHNIFLGKTKRSF